MYNRWEKGLVYEGVPDDVLTGAEANENDSVKPRRRVFVRGSGSETIIMQAIDTFLGIEHYPGVFNRYQGVSATQRNYSTC